MKVLCAAFFYLHVTREKLPKRLLYEKCAHKMLMKLTPVVFAVVDIVIPMLKLMLRVVLS